MNSKRGQTENSPIRYDAILFDFDGVLADTEPVHCAAWAEVLLPLGIQLTWDFYIRHGIGTTDRVMLGALIAHTGADITVDRRLELWPAKQEVFRRLVTANPPLTAAMVQFIHSLIHYDLGVITSSHVREIEPALIAAGVRSRFRTLVGAADVERHKPEPDPYLAGAARLGSSRPLVVEDSDAGVASARAAGFDCVRVASPDEVPQLVQRALAPKS